MDPARQPTPAELASNEDNERQLLQARVDLFAAQPNDEHEKLLAECLSRYRTAWIARRAS